MRITALSALRFTAPPTIFATVRTLYNYFKCFCASDDFKSFLAMPLRFQFSTPTTVFTKKKLRFCISINTLATSRISTVSLFYYLSATFTFSTLRKLALETHPKIAVPARMSVTNASITFMSTIRWFQLCFILSFLALLQLRDV